MALTRRPEAADASPDLAELGSLWQRGLATAHDAGCGCGGLFSPALNARVVEEDFLDYLHARYAKENHGELAMFVDTRRKDESRGVPPNTFDRWILGLDRSPLSSPDIIRLLGDIGTFVESMAGATRRGPGVCY